MATKFNAGKTVMTRTALATFTSEDLYACLNRHLSGDWGDLDAHDRKVNERALKTGERLLSSYNLGKNRTLWIITDAANDAGVREVTTLLLPSDY